MIGKKLNTAAYAADIIFQPALTPLEASVLPALERRRRYGVLAMVPRAYEAGEKREPQRAKIWVR